MTSSVQNATDRLVQTLRSLYPSKPRVVVTEERLGWRPEDLFWDRVNVYLIEAEEDRVNSNDLLGTGCRPVALRYIVTFYGTGAGNNLEQVIGRLAGTLPLDDLAPPTTPLRPGETVMAPAPAALPGLYAFIAESGVERMAAIWGMFRRKYALSIIIEVRGVVVG